MSTCKYVILEEDDRQTLVVALICSVKPRRIDSCNCVHIICSVEPRRINLCICVHITWSRLDGLEGEGQGGGLWNIGSHPIVWNRNFRTKFYLYLGPKMELDGPFQPWHLLCCSVFIFFWKFWKSNEQKTTWSHENRHCCVVLTCFFSNYLFLFYPFCTLFLVSTTGLPIR